MYGKNTVHVEFSTIQFQASTEVLINISPADKGELLYLFFSACLFKLRVTDCSFYCGKIYITFIMDYF